MAIETYQNKVICSCPKCNKTLGAASAVGNVYLKCRKCDLELIFTLQIEPDCLRVTAFIENEKINEKTVSNPTIRNVA